MSNLKFILPLIIFALLGAPQANAQTALIDTFRDWASYEHKGNPSKICFALSKPQKTSPENIQREAAFFYVSAWPKDGVKAEISIKLGMALKKNSLATVRIGSASYRLIIEADKAFVDDATAELKMLESMKRGSKLTVEAITASGKKIRDTYSLRGVTKAIKSVFQACS
jgi:hypothetical protein